MLVVMNSNATDEQVANVVRSIESKGFEARISRGELKIVISAIGSKQTDKRDFELLSGVTEVIQLTTNYKLTTRAFKSEDTIVEVNGVKFSNYDEFMGLIAEAKDGASAGDIVNFKVTRIVNNKNLSQTAGFAVCYKTVKAFFCFVLMKSMQIQSCFRIHI